MVLISLLLCEDFIDALQTFGVLHYLFEITGWAQLDLTRMPAPTKTAKECTLQIYEDEDKHPRMSLFEKKKILGFWPVYDDTLGTRELTVSEITICVSLFHKLNTRCLQLYSLELSRRF